MIKLTWVIIRIVCAQSTSIFLFCINRSLWNFSYEIKTFYRGRNNTTRPTFRMTQLSRRAWSPGPNSSAALECNGMFEARRYLRSGRRNTSSSGNRKSINKSARVYLNILLSVISLPCYISHSTVYRPNGSVNFLPYWCIQAFCLLIIHKEISHPRCPFDLCLHRNIRVVEKTTTCYCHP